ncbi:MAG: Minf_1886 family protein [Thermoguttaceae bacterium]|jgi:uncharacterized repeat protein (TIGR04138 family)
MLDPAIVQLLEDDRRYPLEAYIFVFESLHYAQNVLGMGADRPSEPRPHPGASEEGEETEEGEEFKISEMGEESGPQHHVTGQELCEAIRRYALEQYGYMAKLVLNNWGIRATGDFGEIVFNLIRIGRMRKTPGDRREDFDDVYDFETALCQEFRISMPR